MTKVLSLWWRKKIRKSKILDVVKVMEMEKYGNHEHFKIPKTNKMFVIAVPFRRSVEEGKNFHKDYEEVQILGVGEHALI